MSGVERNEGAEWDSWKEAETWDSDMTRKNLNRHVRLGPIKFRERPLCDIVRRENEKLERRQVVPRETLGEEHVDVDDV